MHENKNCSACNIKLNKAHYKEERTISKDCYNKWKKNKNNNTLIQNQQPKTENVNNNNNPTLLVGPSLSGKSYLLLKLLSRIRDRDIYIITNSPHEQYSNSKIKIKKIAEGMKPLSEWKTLS